jgi:hypothetical protein
VEQTVAPVNDNGVIFDPFDTRTFNSESEKPYNPFLEDNKTTNAIPRLNIGLSKQNWEEDDANEYSDDEPYDERASLSARGPKKEKKKEPRGRKRSMTAGRKARSSTSIGMGRLEEKEAEKKQDGPKQRNGFFKKKSPSPKVPGRKPLRRSRSIDGVGNQMVNPHEDSAFSFEDEEKFLPEAGDKSTLGKIFAPFSPRYYSKKADQAY